MHVRHVKSVAAIGTSALAVAAAVTAMIVQGSPDSGAVAGDMSTGVTVVSSNEATAISVSKAVPSITGTAPLPTEEQGLPG